MNDGFERIRYNQPTYHQWDLGSLRAEHLAHRTLVATPRALVLDVRKQPQAASQLVHSSIIVGTASTLSHTCSIARRFRRRSDGVTGVDTASLDPATSLSRR